MAHMNSKKRNVQKKHRKRKEWIRSGPQQSAMPAFWVYASGRVRKAEDLLNGLKYDFNRFGLKSFSIFSSRAADPGYVFIELKTRKQPRFLLENTHMNLMLRSWDETLNFHESLLK